VGFSQDLLYWRIIHKLVVQHEFRIIYISQDQTEIWLESSRKSGPNMLKLYRADIDWGNWIRQDIEKTLYKAEAIRKKQVQRKLGMLVVYISTYPPVDDWQFITEKPLYAGNKRQTELQALVMHVKNEHDALHHFANISGVQVTPNKEGEMYDYSSIQALKIEVISTSNRRAKQERELFNNGKPYFTYVFIAIQLIMFAFLEIKGGSMNTTTLISFGAKVNSLIHQGEWWRLFTPIFLHIGFFHLLMNTVALYFLGTAVERIYGKMRFLLIYLFAGFAGSAASFVFSPSISAGASGAIFGCFGALLFFGVIYPKLFLRTMGTNVISVIILNLTIGFIFPIVDNAGHIGGLVGGFLASSIVYLPKHRKYLQRVVGLIITIIVTVAILYFGYTTNPSNDPLVSLDMAQDYIENEEYKKAYDVLSKVEVKDENSTTPELFFYLSYTEVELGKYQDAKTHLVYVTEKVPTLHEAHYNLALVYVKLDDYQSAKDSITTALTYSPENNAYLSLAKEINQYLSNAKMS